MGQVEDAGFIAEVAAQVRSLDDAFSAGNLTINDELVDALGQTRDQLVAIDLDGSVDPQSADLRIQACGMIARLVRSAVPGAADGDRTRRPTPGPSSGAAPDRRTPQDWAAPESPRLPEAPSPPESQWAPPEAAWPPEAPSPRETPPPEWQWAPPVAPWGPPTQAAPAQAWPPSPPWTPTGGWPPPSWSPPFPAPLSPPGHQVQYPPASSPRRGRVWLAAIAAAVIVIAAGIVGVVVTSSRASLASLTPAQVMQKSLSAATSAGSGHAEGTFRDPDGQLTTAGVDFSNAGGIETATLDGQTMTVLYFDGSLYMQANASLLSQTLNLSPTLATEYGGQWISLPIDNENLRQMAGELQTSVVVNDLLALGGSLTKSTDPPAGGVALEGILADNVYNEGSGAGDATTLVVSDKAPFYPVSLSYSDSLNGSTDIRFSQWGERLNLVAPKDAVPASALGLGVNSSSGSSGDQTVPS